MATNDAGTGSLSDALLQQLTTAYGVGAPYMHQQIQRYAQFKGTSLESAGEALLKQAGTSPSQTQLRQGAQQYLGYSSEQWAKLSGEQKAQALNQYVQDPSTPQFSPGTVAKVSGQMKDPSKKPTDPSGPTAAQAQQYAIANSPWTQASQVLASGLNTDINALSGLASGSSLGAIDQNTNAMAGALTGTPQSSGAGQWLAAQSAAANAATQPVAAAMQNQQNAFTTGASAFTQALLNMGQANALSVETAPQAGWYNALQTHVASNLNYYGSVPASAESVFANDPALTKALVQSGGYGAGGTGTGLVPVTSLPGAGGSAGSNALTSGAGTVSTANIAPSTGITPVS